MRIDPVLAVFGIIAIVWIIIVIGEVRGDK